MAGSYTLPQLKVFQEFSMAPNDVTRNLNPCVIGPRFLALDYADASTRALCTNKAYTGSLLDLPWSESMPTGSVPDTERYSVTLEDAYVQLANATTGTAVDPDASGKSKTFEFTSLTLDLVEGDYLAYGTGSAIAFARVMSRDGDAVTLDTAVPTTGTEHTVSFTAARLIPVAELDKTHTQLKQASGAVTGITVKTTAAVEDGSIDRKVLKAQAYLNQRSLRTDSTNVIGNVATDKEITEKCGPIVPSNPLAYGLHLVLRNCANAEIRYLPVGSDDDTGWTAALAHLTNTNEVYALCPVTEMTGQDRTDLVDKIEDHCDKMSEPEEKSWRIAFVSDIPDRNDGEDASAYAERIATVSRKLANHRVYNVFPRSLVAIDGYTVDGMYAAAAVCGLACSVLPQQPITNVELEGFQDVPDAYGVFSRTDLNTIAGGGTLIVMQDRPGDVVYIRHQISTAYSKGEGVAKAELSMVRNLDSISYYFANRFAPYIGRFNVTEDLLTEVKGVIKDGLAFLQTATEGNRLIGPQVLAEGTELRNIYIVGGEKDHVAAEVALNLPAPFNNFDLHLQVI